MRLAPVLLKKLLPDGRWARREMGRGAAAGQRSGACPDISQSCAIRPAPTMTHSTRQVRSTHLASVRDLHVHPSHHDLERLLDLWAPRGQAEEGGAQAKR